MQRIQRLQFRELPRRNDGVVVSDLGVIGILGFSDPRIQLLCHDVFHKGLRWLIALQPADILIYFLGHRAGKYSGVCSRISGQLLLIEVLGNLQRLVRTDLKPFGALRLQLRQIEKKRCPLP